MRDALNRSEASAQAARALTRQELLLAGARRRGAAGSGQACSRPASRKLRQRKTGGTLRVGIGGGGPTDSFDAALINGPSATTRGQVFYETLDLARRHVQAA